jgi:hypothetical protein
LGKDHDIDGGGIMSNSSDIERLFEQFGGNAAEYQEIGRENEARIARARWPLLVAMNLDSPSIPTIDDARRVQPATQPQDGDGETSASPATLPATRSGRQPLFALLSQRPPSPVPVVRVSSGELGGARFTASPAASPATATAVASEAPPAEAAPAPEIAAANAAPLVASIPPLAAAAPVPVVVAVAAPIAPPVSAPVAPPATPRIVAPPPDAPHSREPRQAAPTMLRKLFTPAPASAHESDAQSARPTPLASVFARLRGDAPAPAEQPGHPTPPHDPTRRR